MQMDRVSGILVLSLGYSIKDKTQTDTEDSLCACAHVPEPHSLLALDLEGIACATSKSHLDHFAVVDSWLLLFSAAQNIL